MATPVNDPHYSRRAQPPTARMIWSERLSQLSGGILAIVFVLAFAGVCFAWRYWQVRDAADAPLQAGTAVIVGKRVADIRGRAGSGWDIMLKLNGQTVIANTSNLNLAGRLTIGETVAVAYSVGTSGRVYVAEVAETEPTRMPTSPTSR